jgi:ABC-type transporter Mla MlaB component
VPVTLERSDVENVVRLEGEISIPFAAELKEMLIQALSDGKGLRIDLESCTELDITALQLLWAAEREARKSSVGFTAAGAVPEAITAAATAVGFESFPVPIEPK